MRDLESWMKSNPVAEANSPFVCRWRPEKFCTFLNIALREAEILLHKMKSYLSCLRIIYGGIGICLLWTEADEFEEIMNICLKFSGYIEVFLYNGNCKNKIMKKKKKQGLWRKIYMTPQIYQKFIVWLYLWGRRDRVLVYQLIKSRIEV